MDHGCPLTPKIGHRKRRNTEIWYHCREERLDFCEKAIVQSSGLIVVVIAVLIANMPAVMQQWRTDKAGAVQTLWLAGAYVLYVGLGIWFVLGFMAPVGAQGGNALLAVGLLVSWIFYGADPDARRAPLSPAATMADALRGPGHCLARPDVRLCRGLSVDLTMQKSQ